VLAAVGQLFAATPRQRCLVHKQRNVLNAIPRRERSEVQAELVAIWQQPTKQEALVQVAAFKAKYGKRYPEAVRSLAEEEEKTSRFTSFLRSCTDIFRPPMPSKASSATRGSAPIRLTCSPPRTAA
jgi:putative transposase